MVWQPMTSVYVAPVPVQPFESVTFATIGKVPTTVGVPESVPFVASVNPEGNVLDVENVAPPTAPLCVNVCVNGAAATPVVVAGLVTVIVGQVMTRLYVVPVPVQPLPSVTVTTTGNVPVWVGVPERRPADESDKPAGKALAVVNVAPPTAPFCVKFWLNAAPAGPLVVAGLVTVMTLQTVIVKLCGAVPAVFVALIVIG